jgi:endonuclease/exonuclease/phosphatase family metal-dependent hydrolase
MGATHWETEYHGGVGDTLRVMTLNLGHGRGSSSHQALLKRPRVEENLEMVAAALRRAEADVVGLQEADGPCWWSGNFDHVEFLARRGEYPHHYRGSHRRLAQIDCGTALLSRRPLNDPISGSLWSGALRPAKGFVIAAVEFGGAPVDVVSVHVDFMTRGMRRKQLGHTATRLRRRGRPIVLLGDLNCTWGREHTLIELATRLDLVPFDPGARGLATFPQSRPRRRIDWILVSRGIEFTRYEVIGEPLSDHCGVLAELKMSAKRG